MLQVSDSDELKQNYFEKYGNEIQTLVKHGISLSQLKSAEFNKLQNVIAVIEELNDILKVVTLKQIFDIDHEPPSLPKNYKVVFPPVITVEYEKFDEEIRFKFREDENDRCMITHDNSSYTLRYEQLRGFDRLFDNDNVNYFDELASKQPVIRYLHQWFDVPVVDHRNQFHEIQHAYYSPDICMVIFESYDELFPIDKFRQKHPNVMVRFPYYQEINIEKELSNLDYSFDKMRILKGMTETKLRLLTNAICLTKNLLNENVTLPDLALVDEKRLSFLIENHFEYRKALSFVDGKEVLGLNSRDTPAGVFSTNNAYNPTFHSPDKSPNSKKHDLDVSGEYIKLEIPGNYG